MSENIEAGWTLETVQQLKAMAQEGVSTSVMSLKLKRPVTAIHAKLAELGITPAARSDKCSGAKPLRWPRRRRPGGPGP